MVSDLRDRLASFFEDDARGAMAVYLFGSVARASAGPRSDIDVAVLFEQTPVPSLTGPALTLQADLERHLSRPVDLVVLNGAPADLVHRILRDGAIVLDRNRSKRLRFEVTKRNEFFDLEPIRRTYRRRPVPVR